MGTPATAAIVTTTETITTTDVPPVVTTTTTTVSVPAPLLLSPITVDYYGLFAELNADLLAADSWTNLATAGTGTTIMRWIASVGAMCQGSLARSLQENYLDTARSPSGILRAVRLQGVQIMGASAGQQQLSVTRTDSSTDSLGVPAYTQWSVGGRPFINRKAFSIPFTGDNAPVTVILNQGSLAQATFTSDGSTFQRFVIGQSGVWNISLSDLWMVDPNGQTWYPISTGLWREPAGSATFYASILPDGRIECKFGDGNYGGCPVAGTLTFGYTTLLPARVTSTPPPQQSRASAASLTVVGALVGGATPNRDAPPPSFYKAIGPGGAANNQRAVTRDDHRAIALQYPGVIDALFQGQAEINPSDLRWMNVISATLLTTTPWTALQWLNFKIYMETQRCMAGMVLVRLDPTPVPISMPVTIAALPAADINSVTTLTGTAVSSYFALQAGSLGFGYEPSDIILNIMEACTYQQAPNETSALLDYVTVPMDPIQLQPTSYFVLTSAPVAAAYTQRNNTAATLDVIVGMPLIRS